jgi:hypothetical protein
MNREIPNARHNNRPRNRASVVGFGPFLLVIGPRAAAGNKSWRPDCVAEVVGFELRNVDAKYPFESSYRFPRI